MNRTLIAAMAAAGLITFTAPSFAETAAVAPSPSAPKSALADAYMQALIQKCLDNGALLPEQVQQMTDDELSKALSDCAKANKLAAAPAQIIPAAAPVVVTEADPVVVRRARTRFARPAFVARQQVDLLPGVEQGGIDLTPGVGAGGGGGGGAGEVIRDIIVGGLGGGGGIDLTPGVPQGGIDLTPGVPAGVDGRIAGLQSGIQEGILSSALTPSEAGALGKRLAEIQAVRANLGDTPAARGVVQEQLDAAVADFNSKVRNADGVPNPDLFRSLKRKGPNGLVAGQPGLPGLNGLTAGQTGGRFAGFRERMAAKLQGQTIDPATGQPIVGPAQGGKFAGLRERLASKFGGKSTDLSQSGGRVCVTAPCPQPGLDTASPAQGKFAGFRERLAAKLQGQPINPQSGLSTGQAQGGRLAGLRERLAGRAQGQALDPAQSIAKTGGNGRLGNFLERRRQVAAGGLKGPQVSTGAGQGRFAALQQRIRGTRQALPTKQTSVGKPSFTQRLMQRRATPSVTQTQAKPNPVRNFLARRMASR